MGANPLFCSTQISGYSDGITIGKLREGFACRLFLQSSSALTKAETFSARNDLIDTARCTGQGRGQVLNLDVFGFRFGNCSFTSVDQPIHPALSSRSNRSASQIRARVVASVLRWRASLLQSSITESSITGSGLAVQHPHVQRSILLGTSWGRVLNLDILPPRVVATLPRQRKWVNFGVRPEF
jgi:hypothetical protein